MRLTPTSFGLPETNLRAPGPKDALDVPEDPLVEGLPCEGLVRESHANEEVRGVKAEGD